MLDHQFNPVNWYPVRIVPGYQIASGLAANNPFGAGSLTLQLPHFCAQGLPFKNYYAGTINLDVSPKTLLWKKYWHCVRHLQWHRNYPAESFAFCPCVLSHGERQYKGFVYYPLPATKIAHHHSPSIVEVITEFIPNLHYRDTIMVSFDQAYITLSDEPS